MTVQRRHHRQEQELRQAPPHVVVQRLPGSPGGAGHHRPALQQVGLDDVERSIDRAERGQQQRAVHRDERPAARDFLQQRLDRGGTIVRAAARERRVAAAERSDERRWQVRPRRVVVDHRDRAIRTPRHPNTPTRASHVGACRGQSSSPRAPARSASASRRFIQCA